MYFVLLIESEFGPLIYSLTLFHVDTKIANVNY